MLAGASDNVLAEDSSPVPLSFPAILRNPGLSDRYAHLKPVKERPPPSGAIKITSKKGRRGDNEGKRWIRRKENAKFSGNPHIIPASKKDFTLPSPGIPRTFPQPLPTYLSRNTHVPGPYLPIQDPISANAGRFSLSLKGMRRELRRMGGRAESLVRAVEDEILVWLEGGTILKPSENGDGAELRLPGVSVRGREDLREVGRNPLQLVWATDDAFVRYVVHCCARYHEIVSFSKEVQSQRLTYLLRPNVTRPDFRARSALETPPATDLDYTSQEHESDFVSEPPSDVDSDADAEQVPAPRGSAAGLSAIEEDAPVALEPLESQYDDEWSVVGDTDAEGDESGSEHAGADLVDSVASLSLRDNDAGTNPQVINQVHHLPALRSRVWEHQQGRSASSPSRSPSWRLPRRVHPRIDPPRETNTRPKTFYDYLYA